MDNNLAEDNFKIKYNPFADKRIWFVFVLWACLVGWNFFYMHNFFQETVLILLSSIPFIVWGSWIIFKNSKKWSFFIGLALFLILELILIVAIAIFYV